MILAVTSDCIQRVGYVDPRYIPDIPEVSHIPEKKILSQRERIVFQPLFFRGELLNFQGETCLTELGNVTNKQKTLGADWDDFHDTFVLTMDHGGKCSPGIKHVSNHPKGGFCELQVSCVFFCWGDLKEMAWWSKEWWVRKDPNFGRIPPQFCLSFLSKFFWRKGGCHQYHIAN